MAENSMISLTIIFLLTFEKIKTVWFKSQAWRSNLSTTMIISWNSLNKAIEWGQLMPPRRMIRPAGVMRLLRSRFKRKEWSHAVSCCLLIWQEVNGPKIAKATIRTDRLKEPKSTSPSLASKSASEPLTSRKVKHRKGSMCLSDRASWLWS